MRLPDFIWFETIDTLLALCQDERLFDRFPKAREFRDRMLQLPRFGEFYNSDRCLKAPFFAPMTKILL